MKFDKQSLAVHLLTSRKHLQESKQLLLNLMDDNESFDFAVNDEWYRCWKRPHMTTQRPKLDRTNGTFIMQKVVVSPTIIVRSIKERKN